MSELEFEEVKGLQDLGFTFSEDDVDAELASIVPGLRRRRSDEDDTKTATAAAAASAEFISQNGSILDRMHAACKSRKIRTWRAVRCCKADMKTFVWYLSRYSLGNLDYLSNRRNMSPKMHNTTILA
uniref:Uncharacterized protein n=1 Tax=Oryza brachyantha TaxID=4533 RepID=J3MEX4_ORYBR